MRPRVVITGFGAVTPLGNHAADSWKRLVQGDSVRQPITHFDVSGCRCQEGAPVSIEALELPSLKFPRRISRATHLAAPALFEALTHAGLLNASGTCSLSEIPLLVSTTGGAMALGETFLRGVLEKKRSALLKFAAAYQPQQQILELQQAFGIRGPSWMIGNACASGANAIGHGYDTIRAGHSDAVIVGGYEALTELIFVGFDSLQALSPTGCLPFDQNRNGLMLGEGSGFMVLESEAHAQKRGAIIRGQLLGYGQTTDSHHLTQPNPQGTALRIAMQHALDGADLQRDEIGYLNAHGTATPMNDGAEAQAYVDFFGEFLPTVRISSSKAAIGHTLGAAGAIEAIFSLQALREGVAPPQINTTQAISSVALSLVGTPLRGVRSPNPDRSESGPYQSWKATMSVNLGFGGSNAALIFSKFEESP